MVGHEETDGKSGQEDGFFMNLEGEEKEGERRIDLVFVWVWDEGGLNE